MTFAGLLRRVWIPARVRAGFGPTKPGGYFEVNSDPHRVDRARLPWFWQIAANVPAVMANVMAQGNGKSIGGRIVVNGQVKAERISNEVNACTHCLVKGA